MFRFMRDKMNNSKGFTLVEILIVVIILAVLAAIVIPQFSSSTDDAKEAALKTTLTEMRNAIELYYHQHNAVYPGEGKTAAAATDGGTAAALAGQLLKYTDANGYTANVKDATHKYGPYLKADALPKNPMDESNAVVLVSTGDLTATGTDAGGWWYDHKSGKFLANIAAYYSF